MTLRTFGHGTLSAGDVVALLRSAGISSVVDVRRFPGSRRHPHFAREAMAAWLPENGVKYQWEQALGGFRKPSPHSRNIGLRNASFQAYADYMQTPEFWDALDRMLAAANSIATAIMCSESLWWRCHRRLIADALTLGRAVRVEHLFHDGRLVEHTPTPGVKVKDGLLVYADARPTSA